MRKPPTGEPCAGKPPARFGGRGGREPFPTPIHDKLLPSTSNAVERGNRRYRKRQKQVYRVRTQAQISARLALDMWREAQGAGRRQTLHTLHEARAA